MKKILFLVSIALCLASPIAALACDMSKGQTVYVPTVYNYDLGSASFGTTRILIRNIYKKTPGVGCSAGYCSTMKNIGRYYRLSIDSLL